MVATTAESVLMDIWTSRAFSALFERLKNQTRISTVDRLDPLPEDRFYSAYLDKGYPVVFPLAMSTVELAGAVRSIQSNGRQFIDVRYGDYADPSQYVSNRKIKRMSLKAFFTDYFDNYVETSYYAGNFSLPPELVAKLGIRPPTLFEFQEYDQPAFWAGARGTLTPLHKDGAKNFALHLLGRKRWILFPPRDAEFLYLHRVKESSDFAFSEVDIRAVDEARFPEFRKARSIEVEVAAGEVLFLPEGWAHFVENLEPTIMVNFWHRKGSTAN